MCRNSFFGLLPGDMKNINFSLRLIAVCAMTMEVFFEQKKIIQPHCDLFISAVRALLKRGGRQKRRKIMKLGASKNIIWHDFGFESCRRTRLFLVNIFCLHANATLFCGFFQ